MAELAIASGCALDVVQELYQRELSLLQREARIDTYVPLLAARRVRDVLQRERQGQ